MGASENPMPAEVARLETLDRTALIEAWHKAYKTSPFKGARSRTLIRGLTYHMQCKVYGGLKPSVERKLLKIAKVNQASVNTPKPMRKNGSVKVKPGTQLMREWNGKTYTVHVTDKGCMMGGKTYNSLSAAAKAITGAHWSGPRFFGVSGSAP